MKLSAATALVSISSVSAFSAGYLDRLAVPTKPASPSGGGMTSYLDGISSEDQVPGLVTALEQASVAAPAASAPSTGDYLSALNGEPAATSYTPPATAAPAAPAAPNSGDYLSALNSGAPSRSGAGLTSYLDALPPTDSSGPSGAGLPSYLDDMGGAAPTVTAPDASVAATPVATDAPAAGDYLNALSTGSQQLSGAGLTTYLDAIPAKVRAVGGPGLTGYIDALRTNPSLAGAGMTGYLDALAADGGTPGKTVEAFLEGIYSQIMSLPDDGSRQVSGNSMTFAKIDGPYAMSFVKN